MVGVEIMVVVDRDLLGRVTAREAEVLAGIRRHRTNAQLAEDLAAHRNGRLSNHSRVISPAMFVAAIRKSTISLLDKGHAPRSIARRALRFA